MANQNRIPFPSIFSLVLLLFYSLQGFTQEKTDKWLEELLRSKASPFLLQVLNHPDSFQYQVIYTQINRDKKKSANLHQPFPACEQEPLFQPRFYG